MKHKDSKPSVVRDIVIDVLGFMFHVLKSRARVHVVCFVFRVSCFMFRVSCFVFRVSCFMFRVSCFVFRILCSTSSVFVCQSRHAAPADVSGAAAAEGESGSEPSSEPPPAARRGPRHGAQRGERGLHLDVSHKAFTNLKCGARLGHGARRGERGSASGRQP